MARKPYSIKLSDEEVNQITQNGKYKIPEGIREMLHENELIKAKLQVCNLELEKALSKE